MQPRLASQFQSYLDSDESVLWTAKPATGVLFRAHDIFFIPFAIFWMGMTISFYVSWNSHAQQDVFGLFFMLPHFLVGLYMLIGRFIHDSMRRKNTTYAITTHNIYIQSGIFSKSLQVNSLDKLASLKLIEKKDGTGTIELDQGRKSSWFTSRNYLKELAGYRDYPQLEAIKDVKNVYELIIKQKKKLLGDS